MLPAPTKYLLWSHQVNSKQLFDDKAFTSALEMFTHAFNICLLADPGC